MVAVSVGYEPSCDADVLAGCITLSLLLDRVDKVVCKDGGIGGVTAVYYDERAIGKSVKKRKTVALIRAVTSLIFTAEHSDLRGCDRGAVVIGFKTDESFGREGLHNYTALSAFFVITDVECVFAVIESGKKVAVYIICGIFCISHRFKLGDIGVIAVEVCVREHELFTVDIGVRGARICCTAVNGEIREPRGFLVCARNVQLFKREDYRAVFGDIVFDDVIHTLFKD